MKRNLIALAVVAAMTAPAAMAQSANPVTIYGNLRVAFESVKADGGATPLASRSRVSNQLSFLGVRGTEVIGSDLTAFFQIESGISPDTGDSTLASRNSAVGLIGPWGRVLLGKWETPYKVATNVIDPFTTMQLPGMIAVMSDAGNFDLRPNNTLQYWSPTMGDFSFRAHYSANEAKTSTTNPTLYSFSGVYDKAPFFVGYSFEEHNNRVGADATAPTANYKENSNAFFGKYVFNDSFWASVLLQDFKKTGLTKQKAVMVAANYTMGASQFKLSIQRSNDGGATGAPAPSSRGVGIGWYYSLSKRTTITTSYMKTTNNAETNRASFGQNKFGALLGKDGDPTGFSVGINHTF